MNGLYLVQIPRHYSNDIFLDVLDEIVIYRILCEKNNNDKYIDWEKENYELAIIGRSCIHTTVIKKNYKEGRTKIKAGGPISSDPIFIRNSKSGKPNFKIIF